MNENVNTEIVLENAKNVTKDSPNSGAKDTAKEKIILFVIGVLVGALISSVAFFVCVKTMGVNNNTASEQMPGGTPPEMSNSSNGQPSEMPDGSSQPPAKPGESSGQTEGNGGEGGSSNSDNNNNSSNGNNNNNNGNNNSNSNSNSGNS